jgi:glycosyltransferase involved in cell wall biosynthesis
MKKVLIISYYFPPSGGPGVQRVLKFIKYLPQFGWEPIVLTVKDGDYPARDESLLNEIPAGIKVYRTKIFEPYKLYRKLTRKPTGVPVDVENISHRGTKRSLAERLAGFVRETFFIPDARIGWFPYAVPEAIEIIKREKVDAIYSSSPPYTAAVVAGEIARRTHLPWIAGFRDPWIGFISSPERWSAPKAIDRFLEHSVYKNANLVECAWRGIVQDFQAKYPEAGKFKAIHLPNGFDAEDYPQRSRPQNKRFTVTYTGSLYGRRNPQSFLNALEELISEKKVDPKRLVVKFFGRFGSEVHEMITAFPHPDSVEVASYIPHAASIHELQKADALLLIVDESKESFEIVPGKVFEYIGAGRPIVALAQEGAIAEILRETNTGSVAANQDVPAIKKIVLECYDNFLYHRSTYKPNKAAAKKYERREVTRRLAELLDYLHQLRQQHV